MQALRQNYRKMFSKFISYFLIGLTGLVVDNTVFGVFSIGLKVNPTISALISGEAGNLNNFTWNNIFTFKKDNHYSLWRKIVHYHGVALLGLALKIIIFQFLFYKGITFIHTLSARKFVANNAAIAITMVVNFILNYFLTWKAHIDNT